MKLKMDYSIKNDLEEHHAIFNAKNRALSEKFGLKVYLCRFHHRQSPEAVHENRQNRAIIEDAAQRAFEAKFPDLDFRSIFGKNYKTNQEEKETTNETSGFQRII